MKGTTYSLCCILLGLFILESSTTKMRAQALAVYPPHWYNQMGSDTLSLLFRNASDIVQLEISGELEVVEKGIFPNAHYAHATILLQSDFVGEFTYSVNGQAYAYAVLPKPNRPVARFDQSDVLYLITPDRFANGDPSNDSLPGMRELKYGRQHPYGRHGGDIAGIDQQLDYLEKLGVSALWISPLLENDQAHESYHGYAITDHYSIDPRFGDTADYRALIQHMHGRNIKMVKDMVYNHVGDAHFLFTDLPDSSFFNWRKSEARKFEQTSYRATTVMDPHRAPEDYRKFQKGWFVPHMPDLNQDNHHVQRFLIQNTLWWIANFGIDGIRIDTYIYPEQRFMAELEARVQRAFPGFYLFGETWVHGHPVQAYFPSGFRYNPTPTQLSSVTDFQLYYALNKAVNENFGWTEGISSVYYTLAADYLYDHPEQMVTFLDNHDLARFAGVVNSDMRKLHMGYTLLLTTRGIPCLYYGSELGMMATDNHGAIREDFPGGWPEDERDAFAGEDRSPFEDSLFTHIAQLIQLRRSSAALGQGKLMQYVPENGVYVFFRYTDSQVVMVVCNASKEVRELDLNRFEHFIAKKSKLENLLSGQMLKSKKVLLQPYESGIFEVQP